jgi:hypothetical protein
MNDDDADMDRRDFGCEKAFDIFAVFLKLVSTFREGEFVCSVRPIPG